jgi:protocatechuate 3,4-dioxygenase beta subunit
MSRAVRHALAGVLAVALAACGGSSPAPPVPVDAGRSTLVAAPSPATADGVAVVRITATARDAGGAALAGRTAAFSLTGAAATLSAASATTGADGTASVTLQATTAGDRVVSVAIDGVAVTAQATATFAAGPPASVAFETAPRDGTAGTAFAVAVTVADAHGNAVGGATVTLALEGGPAGASLAGATSATTAAGVADFAGLSVAKAGTGYALRATAGGASAPSASFTIAPGAASVLELGGLAASTLAGTSGGATVTARDAFGNVAAGYRGTVHFTSSDPAAVLPGDQSFSAGDAGVHVFAGLQLRTAGAQSVTATDTAAAALTASVAGLQVTPAAPASLAFAAQPPSAVAGELLARVVEVMVLDVFGNLANSPTSVTLGLTGAPAGAALLGTTTVVTATGRAAFADLAVQLAGTGYRLAASGAGLAGATSAFFSISPAAPDAVASDLVASATTATAGTSVAVTATVRDRFGNPAAGAAVTLAATGAGNTLTQPAGPANAAGVAVGALRSTRAEAKTISASAGGIAITDVAPVIILPAAPAAAQSSLAATPTSATADGTPIALTATVADQFANPIPGQTVTFSSTGAATFTPPAAATGADGRASGSVRALSAGNQTITASVGGTALALRDVTFTAPVTVALASPTGTVHVRGAVEVQLTVAGGPPSAVELLKDGAVLARLSPPYHYTWETAAEAEGAHLLSARASAGTQTAGSEVATVVVDRTGPRVTLRQPGPGDAQVPADAALQVVFDEDLLPASVTAQSLVVAGPGGAPLAQSLTQTDARTLRVTLAARPVPPIVLSATLAGTLTDLAGNPVQLPADATWTFTMSGSPGWLQVGGGPIASPGWEGSGAAAVAVDGSGTIWTVRVLAPPSPGTPADAGNVEVRRWSGTAWEQVGPALNTIPGGATGYPDLALDATGAPLVLYGNGGDRLHVGRWNGQAWTALGAEGDLAPSNLLFKAFLTVGPDGPLAGWSSFDLLSTIEARLNRWDGVAWRQVGQAIPILADRAAAQGDRLWTAGFSNGECLAWRWDGASWASQGAFPASTIDLAASATDVAVAYFTGASCDVGSCAQLQVERWTGTAFQRLAGDPSGGLPLGRSGSPSIQLGPGGNPVVAWTVERPSGTQVLVAAWDGAGWLQLGPIPVGIGSRVDLALDPSGEPIVAEASIDEATATVQSRVFRRNR